MTTYRDRLPLAHPDYLGLPYHGLVTNEVLTLPNSHTRPVAFGGHQTVLVRAAGAAVPSFTPDQQAFNTAQGYTWQNFALLSGQYRNIGGQALGPASYLYHDGDHAWIVDVEVTRDDLELTLSVYLRQLFGYLDDADEAPTMPARRKLDELTFIPVRTGGTNQTEAMSGYDRYLFMTHSQTGSTTAANVAVSRAEVDASDFGVGFAYQFGGSGYVVHNALKIQLTGKGSLTGTIGSGISGAITMLATAQQMHSYSSTSSGTTYTPNTQAPTAVQTYYNSELPGCGPGNTVPQYWEITDANVVGWDGVADSDTSDSGEYSTATASRHYVAVTKAGDLTWLETETSTNNSWSTETISSGSMTLHHQHVTEAYPSCSFYPIAEEYEGGLSWTKTSTQTIAIDYVVRFGGQEYAQSLAIVYESLEEWEAAESILFTPVKITNIVANNAATPEFVASCGTTGYVTKSCAAVWQSNIWVCGASGALGGLTMVEPQVFRITGSAGCSGGATEYAYALISCNGETEVGYTDPAGTSARLVSYNPNTGAFAIAGSASDTVCWV